MTKPRVGRIVVEMVIVFAGVYGAFALDEYRSTRQEESRRQQILEALQKDFSASPETLDQAQSQMALVVDSMLTEYEAGTRPQIGAVMFSVSFRSGTWDAMLASGGVNILDIDLIFAVENYYENVQALREAAAEGRRLSAELILPVVDEGNDVFYESEGGLLKRKYRWFMTSLADYRDRVSQLRDQNRQILDLVNDRLR